MIGEPKEDVYRIMQNIVEGDGISEKKIGSR